ncbi:MAG: D-aminoacyl-tRNA deacylase [Fusobacteria bacterium]|nr:D-aminoacyl-tRNA deacylase [Fusobacteriota bacterium]
MKGILQRANNSFVKVEDKIVGHINTGLVVFLGVSENDTLKEIDLLVNKIINLRIFEDDEGKMNKSILDINGEILLVSQFTLLADTKKGRRPSFIKAAHPEKAKEYYEIFISKLQHTGLIIETGIFQANMKVHIENDGPVTIILDTEELGRKI